MNINSGATINVVTKYLGHTKIDETLNTYSHLFKNQLNEIINTIDKLNQNGYLFGYLIHISNGLKPL